MAGLNLDAALGLPASSDPADPLPAALCPPPKATAVDKDGDLYLVVGAEKRAFRVDSRALVRVSTVWKRMV